MYHSWKRLIAKSSITLQLPKPMGASPVSAYIFTPRVPFTARLGTFPLLALVSPSFSSLSFLTSPAQCLAGSFARFLSAALSPGSGLLTLLFLLGTFYLVDLVGSSPPRMALIGVSLTQPSQLRSSVSSSHGIFTWLPLGHLKHDWSKAEISGPHRVPHSAFPSESLYRHQCIRTRISGGDLASASPTHSLI